MMNDSTREIIEREIKRLDQAISDAEANLAEVKATETLMKADLAAARLRRAELELDLAGSQPTQTNYNICNVTARE